jgi:heptosyltransferase-2
LKILFIRFSSLGDILLTFPFISAIKKKYPNSKIFFVTKSEYASLFSLNRDIDSLLLFDKENDSLWKLSETIRNEKFDYIFDLHNNLRSNLVLLFNASKNNKLKKYSFRKWLLVKTKINYLKNLPLIRERYSDTSKKFNLIDSFELKEFINNYTISIDKVHVNNVKDKLPFLRNYEKILGLCPSARHKTKILSENKLINIGKQLLDNNKVAILIFGDQNESEYCERLRNSLSVSHAYNIAGKTSIIETATILSLCNIVIANDTGLMHLTNLLHIPLIAIFGSTVKEFGFYPTGKNSFVVENVDLKCRPCSHIGLSICPNKHFKCMNDINEKLIVEKAMPFLLNV